MKRSRRARSARVLPTGLWLGAFLLLSTVTRADVDLGGSSGLKENLDLPYDAGGGTADDEEAPEVLVFFGQTYEASAVVFALDESGSMNENGRWQLQTREVVRSISEQSGQAEFGVVYYGSRVTSFRNVPIKASPGNKAGGISWIRSRRPAGDTCIGEGTVRALEIVRRSESRYKAVIVTSDGRPDNCATGDRATPQEVQRIYQQTLAANPGKKVKVHTIWVGNQSDRSASDFLRRLAQLHSGTFRQVTR